MRVTRRTFTGLYVTEEMTREEYRRFRVHRAVTIFLAWLIVILSMLCGSIWLIIFLGL